jgi:putative tryptophan/tyrosine transport system substrate-binding protein
MRVFANLGPFMRRREFIALCGVAVTWPLAARAQQPERMRRIGVLETASEADAEGEARMRALRQGLLELGWSEGRNLKIDYRWTGGDDVRARAYAAELVALQPDVIFAAPSSALAQAQRATRTIPIVFAQIADPVGAGFVTSLANPGGNITGFAVFEFAIGGKWLELLKQIAPSVRRIAAIYDPATPSAHGFLPMIEAAGRSSGVDVFTHAVRDTTEIERVINTFAAEPNGGLIPVASALLAVHRDFVISLANRHRLPNIYAFRYYPANGGLASYGVDNIDLYKRAASYIDRILNGEKPANLPVQLATKYDLVINIKTAKALGLDIPDSVLARADEVIE